RTRPARGGAAHRRADVSFGQMDVQFGRPLRQSTIGCTRCLPASATVAYSPRIETCLHRVTRDKGISMSTRVRIVLSVAVVIGCQGSIKQPPQPAANTALDLNDVSVLLPLPSGTEPENPLPDLATEGALGQLLPLDEF